MCNWIYIHVHVCTNKMERKTTLIVPAACGLRDVVADASVPLIMTGMFGSCQCLIFCQSMADHISSSLLLSIEHNKRNTYVHMYIAVKKHKKSLSKSPTCAYEWPSTNPRTMNPDSSQSIFWVDRFLWNFNL